MNKRQLLHKYIEKIKHIVLLIGMAFFLEVLYQVVWTSNIEFHFTLKNLIYLLFFNACYLFESSQPLWFLFALVYDYIFFYLITFWEVKEKFLLYIASILLYLLFFLEILFSKGLFTNNCIYRNWLFEGIPLMISGMYIKKYSDRLVIKKLELICLFACSLMLTVLECICNIGFEVNIPGIVLAISIIIFSINSNIYSKALSIVSIWGAKCTMVIYIIHLYCNAITGYIMRNYVSSEIYYKFKPVFVIIVSIFISTLIYVAEKIICYIYNLIKVKI